MTLRLWSIAAFRATTFLVAIALALHLRGTLPQMLAELNTVIGFGAFVVFWMCTIAASRLGLRYRADVGDGPLERLLAATIVAGAWNGAFVFLAIVGCAALAAGGLAVIVFAGIFVIGSTVAFAFGGVAGLVYGLVEGALFALSAALAHHALTTPNVSTVRDA